MSFIIKKINKLNNITKPVVPIPEGTSKNVSGLKFYNRLPTSMPDIDYDVSDPMVLKDMLIQEWGDNVVVPISNWNTLQLKSLIKDISKFYEIPFNEVNAVTNVMLKEATPAAKRKHDIRAGVYTPTFEETIEFSDSLKKFLNKYPQVSDHVMALYGSYRSCFTDRVSILTDKGYKTIKEIEDGDRVAYMSESGDLEFNDSYMIFSKGVKEVFEVELEDGTTIELTEDHEVMTQDGYKKVKDLTEKDFLFEV